MEEKERYKWSQDVIVDCAYEDYDYIVDTKNNIIFDDDNYFELVDLLNQQDKENQQLKQQLHELPKKIVEEIEKNFTEYLPLKYKTGAGFYSRLNAILKKYGDRQ